MKRLLMLGIGLLSMSFTSAQDITDAIRYSDDAIQGTARFRSMSGAFGALGGDMSSVNINPAGSVIFTTSHASISAGLFNTNNDVSYFGTLNSTSNTNIDINQFGAAFIFKNTDANSKWKRFALSVAYDRSTDYDDDWIASGVNDNNSIVEYFQTFANGRRLDEISALPGETLPQAYNEIGSFFGYANQQAFLGFEGFLIDPVNDTDDNTEYVPNIAGSGVNNTPESEFNQRYAYVARGYNGKMAFNFATSYNDRLHFGLNLNVHFINYERTTLFSESNNNIGSVVTDVDFENNLLTTGGGFSFQLGGIAKITEALRVGVSYNSPTWFRINEETSQFLASTRVENNTNITQIVNPNVINIFPEYRFQTPGRLTGSLAYVFGKKGLLSFDYSVRDYTNASFRPTSDPDFSVLNTDIRNLLDTAQTYRLGGEYRFKQLSVRGGYRMEESPYKDDSFYGDLTGYSFGLGYNFGNFNLDLAFSRAERDINYQLFTVGLTDEAQIQSKFTDVILSFTFNM